MVSPPPLFREDPLVRPGDNGYYRGLWSEASWADKQRARGRWEAHVRPSAQDPSWVLPVTVARVRTRRLGLSTAASVAQALSSALPFLELSCFPHICCSRSPVTASRAQREGGVLSLGSPV